MKLLLLGDGGGTGFGTVTADLGRELLRLGLDVRFLSLNEAPSGEDLPEPFAGRTALLGAPDGWLAPGPAQEERVAMMFRGGLFEDGWQSDAGLVIGDVGSLKVSGIARYIPPGFPVLHYCPVEGVGLPPRWNLLWQQIRPVAMSEFGADEIAKVTGTRPPVVYHGVDTDTFHPVSAQRPLTVRTGKGLAVMRSKADCKRFVGWPTEGVTIYRADRHMPRKNYPSLLRSMAAVLARHPDARLVWHCKTLDQGGDLLDERSKYPDAVAKRMHSTGIHDQFGGAPRDLLAVLYNAADIYVSNSPEGFGLTIAEALACGVPVVGLDYSAVPEVVGGGGVVVPVGMLVDNIYSHFWALPDERAFANAVSELVLSRGRRRMLGQVGAMHVQSSFQWARAAEQFADLLGAGRVRQPEAISA